MSVVMGSRRLTEFCSVVISQALQTAARKDALFPTA